VKQFTTRLTAGECRNCPDFPIRGKFCIDSFAACANVNGISLQ
jgi:hypothetical protein